MRTSETRPSAMGASCADRGRQDGDRATRPSHPPLSYPRNRKRQLALQKSRLTFKPSEPNVTALAPAAQPRPAPPGRALLSREATSRGPYSVQIWGPVSVLIDSLADETS